MPKCKIEAMYEQYGHHDGEKCRDCVNLVCYRWRSASYRKCAAYGVTRSESTDWALKYDACGLFGIPFPDGMRPMVEVKKHDAKTCPDTPTEGQIGFDEIEEDER